MFSDVAFKEKLITIKFNDISTKIMNKTELFRYAQENSDFAGVTCDSTGCDYTVLGFDWENKVSFVFHTRAKDSISALGNVFNEIPIGASHSVYPGKLSALIKFDLTS